MQNSFPAPLPHAMPVLLRLSLRPAYWRVAVITPDGIFWRTYSRAAYPDAGAVLTRCMTGLVSNQDGEHEAHAHGDEGGRRDVHSAPPSELPTPEAGDAQRKNRQGHAEVQERVRHPAPPAGRARRPARRLRVAWWGWLGLPDSETVPRTRKAKG